MATPSHSHSHIPDRRTLSGQRLVWTIIMNVMITLAEAIAGWLTGYLALLADAVHNLSDVAALVLAWLGWKASTRPATKRSTYGSKRVEVMTALISAVSLVVIAIFIIREAYERLISPQPITKPGLFLTVAVVGLVGNVVSVWLLNAGKGSSLNVKTAFLHMLYDALSSVVVIGGGIAIMLTHWYPIDTILSVAIALMIFWSSYLVIKEAVNIFLEAVPATIDFDEVHRAIAAIAHVSNVHDLHIWSLSSTETALSCHVSVAEADYRYGPQIIEQINHLLNERFAISHGTVQIELAGCDRPDLLCNDAHPGTCRTDEQTD